MKVAACVFCNWNSGLHRIDFTNAKLYYYANPAGLTDNSYALVHNGRDFGVVYIVRTFDGTPPAIDRVTKPLLAYIDPISNLPAAHANIEADKRLNQLQMLNAQLDKELKKTELSGEEDDE